MCISSKKKFCIRNATADLDICVSMNKTILTTTKKEEISALTINNHKKVNVHI